MTNAIARNLEAAAIVFDKGRNETLRLATATSKQLRNPEFDIELADDDLRELEIDLEKATSHLQAARSILAREIKRRGE